MKNVTLIKSHPSVQLGHLYEHLFMKQVNDFFYKKSLLKFVDYSAHGSTFDSGGLIIVDCDLYSEQAQQYDDAIESLHIECGQNNELIRIALRQMSAEEAFKLRITSEKNLLSELMELDQQPWQPIDDLDSIDTKSIRRKRGPIYATRQPQARTRQLQISLFLDKDFTRTNRSVVPVFDVLARTLILTLCSKLSWRYGGYAGGEIKMSAEPIKIFSEMRLDSANTHPLLLEDISNFSQKIIHRITSEHTLRRIENEYSSISYKLRPTDAPDYERILAGTKIFVGAKGWQKITTVKNIRNLLAYTTIELKLGRQKLHQKLK